MKIVYNTGIHHNDWLGAKVGNYEYLCVAFDDYKDSISTEYPYSQKLIEQGWERAWADVTLEGTFAVYRRPFKKR